MSAQKPSVGVGKVLSRYTWPRIIFSPQTTPTESADTCFIPCHTGIFMSESPPEIAPWRHGGWNSGSYAFLGRDGQATWKRGTRRKLGFAWRYAPRTTGLVSVAPLSPMGRRRAIDL
jgi:hypothetical protein